METILPIVSVQVSDRGVMCCSFVKRSGITPKGLQASYMPWPILSHWRAEMLYPTAATSVTFYCHTSIFANSFGMNCRWTLWNKWYWFNAALPFVCSSVLERQHWGIWNCNSGFTALLPSILQENLLSFAVSIFWSLDCSNSYRSHVTELLLAFQGVLNTRHFCLPQGFKVVWGGGSEGFEKISFKSHFTSKTHSTT